jgi:hypothetical protein
MGKERNYNPAEAQRKLDKKKEKQKAKETVKNNFNTQALQQDNRRAEQELSQFLTSNADIKLATSASFQSKLGKVNEVRIKLGLPVKGIDDYNAEFKAIKKQLKSLKKNQYADTSQTVASIGYPYPNPIKQLSIPTESMEEKSSNFEEKDLSGIQIPVGIPPETEGQTYQGLSQLRIVKCTTFLEKQKSSQANQPIQSPIPFHPPPPPPPVFDPVHLPFPGYMPSPFNPGTMMNMDFMIPPPPPLYQADQKAFSNQPVQHHRKDRNKGRLYATSSHATPQGHDPLAPEINEPLEKSSKQQVKSQIVYGSAPKMRDFKKEVTGFVPAALLKKKS